MKRLPYIAIIFLTVLLVAFDDAQAGRFLRRGQCKSHAVKTTRRAKRSSLVDNEIRKLGKDRLPVNWNLAEIKKAAYGFGESKVLAWSILEDNRPLRVENCLVGNIAGEGEEWRIIVLFRRPLSKNKFWHKWHVPAMHVTYPKGHRLFPGFWHSGFELFEGHPSDKDVVVFLSRPTISWSFTTDAKWRLIDSHISPGNWKWFTGELPSSEFRE